MRKKGLATLFFLEIAGCMIFTLVVLTENQSFSPKMQAPAPVATTLEVPAVSAPVPSPTSSPSSSVSLPSAPAPKQTPKPTPPAGYTAAQVRLHSTAASCWSIVGGSVYDLTTWISEHPGGAQAILGLCGIDGTDAFNEQHGGQRNPEQELTSLRIGPLVQ